MTKKEPTGGKRCRIQFCKFPEFSQSGMYELRIYPSQKFKQFIQICYKKSRPFIPLRKFFIAKKASKPLILSILALRQIVFNKEISLKSQANCESQDRRLNNSIKEKDEA